MRLLNGGFSWLRTLLICAGIYILALLYGFLNFYGDPGGVFYNDEWAHQQKYSTYRKQEANHYIDMTSGEHKKPLLKTGTRPRFCASVIAIRRPGEQSIKTTVSSALQGLTVVERRDLRFHVHFSHTNPLDHPDFEDEWLRSAADSVHSYNVTDQLYVHLQALEADKKWREIAFVDYTEEMQRCYDTGAQYIGIFYDDLIFANGWFAQTMQGIADVEEQAQKAGREWLYLRLFDREGSMHWDSRKIGSHREFPMIVLVSGLAAVFGIVVRFLTPRLRRFLDNPSLGIICLVLIPALIILFFQSGKSSVLRPTYGAHLQTQGCCEQAFVFPREQVPRIRASMRDKEYGFVDIWINHLADRIEIVDRYALYPIQVQDMGVESVRGSDAAEDRIQWNTAFERMDPKSLEREHLKLVQKLYPD